MYNAIYKIIWIPIFHIAGKRIRARMRFILWHGFHYDRENFEDKTVIRVWLGFLKITALIDDYAVRCDGGEPGA